MALLRLPREIGKLFGVPSLRTVLIAITIYWLGYSYYPFIKDPTINIPTLIISLMWLLLVSGMWAKIKGFKITNGIVSICIFFMSIFSFSLVAENLNILSMSSIPLLLVYLSSGYTTYITLMNKQFAALYKNKADISAFRGKFFQFSLAIFVILVTIVTGYELIYMGTFGKIFLLNLLL